MRCSTPPRRWALVPSLLVAALVALAGLAAPAVAVAAPAPSATLTLTASPALVAPGEAVTLSGTLTNTGGKTETFTVAYTVSGPCGYSDSYSLSVRLRAGESQTASATRTAPACTGTYIVTATASVGGTVVATASTSVSVQEPTVAA